MFVSITAAIDHCIPILKNLQFGECLCLVQPNLLDPWCTAESKVSALNLHNENIFWHISTYMVRIFLTYIIVYNFAA